MKYISFSVLMITVLMLSLVGRALGHPDNTQLPQSADWGEPVWQVYSNGNDVEDLAISGDYLCVRRPARTNDHRPLDQRLAALVPVYGSAGIYYLYSG